MILNECLSSPLGVVPWERLTGEGLLSVNSISFALERSHCLRSQLPDGNLASSSSEPWGAEALEGGDSVYTASSVEAGLADAVIQVDGAETAGETRRAQAGKTVHAIQTGGAIGTGAHQAVVHVGLAAGPREAGQASARQFWSVTTQILTETTILAGGPAAIDVRIENIAKVLGHPLLMNRFDYLISMSTNLNV